MLKIHSKSRILKKTTGSRKLRKKGKCPAIIYKHSDHLNLSIELNNKDIQKTDVFKNLYKNNIIQLSIDCKIIVTVKIQDIQFHPYKKEIVHIDFIQI